VDDRPEREHQSGCGIIALMFWGWLWGVWGMLLSVPLIVIIKVISEHLEGLHPVAELLSASK